ncbi:MAG: UvrD-helicase domain-containing protein [Synergistaceae bacterium]|jgi:ATP-dependent exoDNAse (exonuclease V) beta subunit|nr:UvrD-helicase domain-containing protein [Synergistaceae bacterium]
MRTLALTMLLPEGTPEGQARAVTRDDDLVTVGAGAGTGKTWVLSARFARLLFSDPECLPQNILTLTFTEAAAREMQDRIRRRAFELLAALPDEEKDQEKDQEKNQEKDQEKSRRQALKDGFDETWISTIHSFASRLIRESGLSLDVDPRSGVVNAPQEDAFWGSLERALENLDLLPLALPYANKTLRDTASFLERDATLLAALEKWGSSVLCGLARDVTELHASLGNSHETLLTWAEDVERVGAVRLDVHARTTSEAVLELLRPRWAAAWQMWRTIFTELGREIFEARDRAREKIEAKRINPAIPLAETAENWQDLLSREEPPGPDVQRAFYLDLCSKLSGDGSKLFKTIAGHLGQTSSKWRDAQSTWIALSEFPPGSPLSEAEQRLRASLLRFSAFAWGLWDETKRRRGLLSFSDMIYFAAQSIDKDARAKGFKHVLIDEFQDTDPQQDNMIRALREKEGAKLFLVGDPKQAIYRFRHADLTLFADYVLQSRASNADVSLNVSFRTRAALMDRINSLFSRVWKDGLGVGKRMESLKFEPLSVPQPSERGFAERELASVPPFTLLLSVKKGRGDQARERLGEGLARTFARYVKEGRTVWDKGQRCLRPVRWKDFAVLTPTRSEYEILEAAFEREGIPAAFEKSMSYFSRGEVVDVVNALRVAAFPDDEAALAGWLASPLSGTPQREAQACLQARLSAPLHDALRERLPATFERLSYMRRLGSLKGPSAVLSYLLEDRRWLASFDAAQRLRVVGNVNRAITVARQYENGVSPTLAGCAQWLDTALRAGRAIEEPEWVESDADAVRVMTVHASKGLEFPVVAVMRMERGPRSRNPTTVAASKHMGVALSDMPDMMKSMKPTKPGENNNNNEEENEEESEVKAYSLKWERALSAQSELEESTRLFYVAATRAQDSLILCGIVSEESQGGGNVKDDTWLSWTLNWLAEERGCDWRDLKGPPLVYVESGEEAKEPDSAPPLDETGPEDDGLGRPRKNGEKGSPTPLPATDGIVLSSFSATSFALFEWCPFAWRRRHRQGLDLRWEIPDADAVGGSELGSIAHWILSRWDMREETLHQWLDNPTVELRLAATLRRTWRDAENREALRGWLTAFSLSEEGRSLANAARIGTLRRESPFCVMIDAANGLSTLRLVGATDVLWRDDGFWHVRDYKITLSDNAPAELYRAQLTFYALVVKLLTERSPLPFDGVDVGLIFLREGGRLGDAKSLPQDEDWETLRNQVVAAARAAAQGPWIPRREHCRRCPWRLKCPQRG